MSRIVFYLRYAYRNLRRSGRWTWFAIFCIAAGVTTVVALRSLGLAIADSLVANVRASNHGDITLSVEDSGGFLGSFLNVRGDKSTSMTAQQVAAITKWVSDRNGQMTAYLSYSNFQVTSVNGTNVGRPQFVSAFFVDPQTFPPSGEVRALDPAGVPLSQLLTGGNDIVISRNLADSQNLKVGDSVRVSATTDAFTVRGIVSTDLEANVRNIFASFFGFAYLNYDQVARLGLADGPNTLSITLPNYSAATPYDNLVKLVPGADIQTVSDLLERNQIIGDYLGRFIVTMGLGALLIGGVGIINTMLVMVGRRTTEIAALKTFGLKGRQIAAIFLAEAFLLGLVGSVVGSAVGVLIGGLVNQYGEQFLQQRLVWRIYPEAIGYGLGLGLIVTMVFGLLPVLTAIRVRPAIILRPNETVIPGIGWLHSLIALALVVVIIGGIAGQILGVLWLGIAGVAATLVILGILIGVLWVVVWLVGKLPAFGSVDLRLALRNLSSRRLRTATTLLALSAGMFALSSITFIGAGTREILQFQLTRSLGGNIMVLPYASVLLPELGQAILRAELKTVPDIDRVTELSFYTLRLLKVNGDDPKIEIPFIDPDRLPSAARRMTLAVTIQNSDQPTTQTVTAGRMLTPEDRGQHVIVLSNNKQIATLGIGVGSTVTLRVSGQDVDFQVVGLVGNSGSLPFSPSSNLVPPDSLGGTRPTFTLNVLQVAPEHLNAVLLRLSSLMPPVLALDLQFIDGLLSRLINQFSAIPTLVGLLSLLAAAVIMANTVSLATLERRRQIGILKAVGLKGRRVLWIMLLENTIIGLLGGGIGIGLSALGVAIMTALGMGDSIPVPGDARLTAMALIAASVVIAWIATLASARVAISENVTNVLRYE